MPNENQSEKEILASKLLNNTITPEEMERLECWYAEVSEDAPVWNLKDKSPADLQQRLLNSIRSKINVPQPKYRIGRYLAVAASIAVIGMACFFVFNQEHVSTAPTMMAKSSTAGKIIKIHLPDQSIVWLKGDSHLDYPSKFSDSTRNVTLRGEALFEVAKDKKHPFVIRTSAYTTRVLGTSFNISEADKSFRLTVLTGKVSILPASEGASAKNNKPVVVTPGTEFVVNNPAEKAQIVAAPATDKVSILNGTEYDMNFENTPFEEVRLRIEKKFNVKINAGKDAYQNCFLSADVTDQSLDNTLKVLSAVLNAQYSINKNLITLTGGGCNS
ncbi:putative transmembrane sensor/regulatory protein [Pedobacter sp. BAL39]|uniref:FecR family protein n=1 Tax=Pedobacter sp. BAL39 TaxID=391596 RepID=UPI0001559A70|nr:FecR family protein [Pedobacter sp. BAL39]EDM38635.1 putative transmembrane sensor/regulatory protein [Pedobacter sp. BAL39]